MLDIKLVRTDPDLVKENMRKKFQEDMHRPGLAGDAAKCSQIPDTPDCGVE